MLQKHLHGKRMYSAQSSRSGSCRNAVWSEDLDLKKKKEETLKEYFTKFYSTVVIRCVG